MLAFGLQLNMSKILIACDGSSHSEDAFKWYVKTLRQPNDKVILLTCPELYFVYEMSGAAHVLHDQIADDTQKLKSKWLTTAKNSGVECEWMEKYASKPGYGIVDVAINQNVDVIVIGTRGMGKIMKTIFGSVSDHVVHHAPCPVLVYRT